MLSIDIKAFKTLESCIIRFFFIESPDEVIKVLNKSKYVRDFRAVYSIKRKKLDIYNKGRCTKQFIRKLKDLKNEMIKNNVDNFWKIYQNKKERNIISLEPTEECFSYFIENVIEPEFVLRKYDILFILMNRYIEIFRRYMKNFIEFIIDKDTLFNLLNDKNTRIYKETGNLDFYYILCILGTDEFYDCFSEKIKDCDFPSLYMMNDIKMNTFQENCQLMIDNINSIRSSHFHAKDINIDQIMEFKSCTIKLFELYNGFYEENSSKNVVLNNIDEIENEFDKNNELISIISGQIDNYNIVNMSEFYELSVMNNLKFIEELLKRSDYYIFDKIKIKNFLCDKEYEDYYIQHKDIDFFHERIKSYHLRDMIKLRKLLSHEPEKINIKNVGYSFDHCILFMKYIKKRIGTDDIFQLIQESIKEILRRQVVFLYIRDILNKQHDDHSYRFSIVI